MGIRFACHVCSKKLNIKQELAGRRGICPACSAKFRIPLTDAERSTPLDDEQRAPAADARPTNGHARSAHSAVQAADSVATLEVSAVGQSIDLIDSDPTSTWYVRPPSGGQYGPATGEILRQWISEGRVAATSLLWREGWPQWREAKEVLPELVSRLPDAGLESTPASNRVSSREADEFGFGDLLATEAAGSMISSAAGLSESSHRSGAPTDRSISDRSPAADRRTLMILGLTGLAICLVAALAFVLSR